MSVRLNWPGRPQGLGRVLTLAVALSAAAAIAEARVPGAAAPTTPETNAMLQPAILVSPSHVYGRTPLCGSTGDGRGGCQATANVIPAIAESGPPEQRMTAFDAVEPVAAAPNPTRKEAASGHRSHRRDRAPSRDLPRPGSRTAERD